MKKYDVSLVVGRFQPIHIGHEAIINKALELSNKLIIFIGSSDKKYEINNPFSYEFRKSMINLIYQDEIEKGIIEINPLKDIGVGNVFAWGDYMIKEALKYTSKIDLFVSGSEAKIDLWFNEEYKKNISFIKVSREDIKISATELRDYIYNNEYDEFKKYVNNKLHNYYSLIRLELMKAYVKPTKSKIIFEDED